MSDLVEIIPQLYLSDWKSAHDYDLLKKHKIEAFVNVCEEESTNKNAFHCPIKDLPLTGMSWVSAPALFCEREIKSNKNVLVHGKHGISRSVALILYYLMTRREMSLFNAFHLVKTKRICICPSIGFMKNLSKLEKEPSFLPEAYTKFVLSERFPQRTKEEIHQIYIESTKRDPHILIDSLGTDNLDPVGYYAIDMLRNLYPKEFISFPKYTDHHPFD